MHFVLLFSASLAIRIAQQSAIVIDHVVPRLSVRTSVLWQKIRMPFGVVSGVGLGMGVLDFGGDRRRGRGSFFGGVNLRRPIVTNGEFVASLRGSA